MNKKITLLCLALTLFSVSMNVIASSSCNKPCPVVCDDPCGDCEKGCTLSQNLWQPHAFSGQMDRELILQKYAWTEHSNECDSWHGTFAVGFDYMRNWGECCKEKCKPATTVSCEETKCCASLGTMPFWSGTSTMKVGDNGLTDAGIASENAGDIDAFQMGLGNVSDTGEISLNPRVYQAGADFLLYFGAHRTEPGFWFKLHGPIGVMNVDPQLSESDPVTKGTYNEGFLNQTTNMATPAAITEPLYSSMIEAFEGGNDSGFYKKLEKGLINCKRTSSAKFGDLEVAVGYNFLANECSHFGIGLRFSAPTGNKPESKYILEPIFGRAGHWGMGAELFGHYRCWESDDCGSVDLWVDGYATHLFKARQLRTFDLKNNGKGSKYMLLAKYSGDGATDSASSAALFQNEIQNAINLTCLPIESTFSVEGTFALFVDYHYNCWNFGIGYSFWGRSCEKLEFDCSCPSGVDLSDWAVVGRQQAYGVQGTQLGYVEPNAQINKSQVAETMVDSANNTIKYGGVKSNRLPEKLDDALDICGQRAHHAMNSKIFFQTGHTWHDEDFSPFIGASGSIEFAHSNNSAPNMWSVGMQGGISF